MGCQCTKSNEVNNMNLDTTSNHPKGEPAIPSEVNNSIKS